MKTRKNGLRCNCKPGQGRDNCSNCEGDGWAIDFAAIHWDRKCYCGTMGKPLWDAGYRRDGFIVCGRCNGKVGA